MHGGAHIMSEPGKRELSRAGSPADRVAALHDLHAQPGASESHRGGETVRAGTDDDGIEISHTATLPPPKEPHGDNRARRAERTRDGAGGSPVLDGPHGR